MTEARCLKLPSRRVAGFSSTTTSEARSLAAWKKAPITTRWRTRRRRVTIRAFAGLRSNWIARPRSSLYRPGYYPGHSQEALKRSGAHMLAAAMQPGLPQSTMLVVTAKLLPPDATSKALRIDYSIDLSGLDFIDTTDNRKRALLDCMAVALDPRGQIAGQIANTMDAALPPQQYQVMQQTGLPLHQELVLPPGTYDLRLGVLDRASQKIGTVDIPVVIPAEGAPAATGTGVGLAKASAAEPTPTNVVPTATVVSNASSSSAPVRRSTQQPTGIPSGRSCVSCPSPTRGYRCFDHGRTGRSRERATGRRFYFAGKW